ncbi:hypothetical protein WA026_012061 [Henosepilachna vigintioctopunctata]|uniref:Nucleotide exchange factor SIL1 n=1 Tax=Henosepilachna vigintioctopunctata TaxID=420089 RepID=A0AAW1V4V0_9CUCU
MKLNHFIFIICLVLGAGAENENEDVFVADTEWKEIKEGQKIPPGLHIRINLQTGKKEAKLQNEDMKKEQALVITKGQKAKVHIPFSELKQTLKNIKSDEGQESSKTKGRQFRTYEEIKTELGGLNLIPKLDSEIIKELINDFKKNEKLENRNITKIKNILEDLEYLSHQIDNAIEFVNQNGFRDIVYKALNDSTAEIKIISLRLMSSLMQNNPKVQIHALQTSCINELLKILTLEKSISIKYQAITALSSILRRFPLAQKRFMENGGLAVISKVFQKGDIKLKVKLTTLVMDLVTEHQLSSLSEDSKDALKQYEEINIEDKLIEHDWCENVKTLLKSLVSVDEDNHDFIEKSLRAMNILVKHCAGSYDDKVLNYLVQKYNKLGVEGIDEDDEYSLSSYFSELKDLCDDLLKSNKVMQKTEL